MSTHTPEIYAALKAEIQGRLGPVGITDPGYVVFGDLRYLPSPTDIKSATYLLLWPKFAGGDWLDAQQQAETQTVNWTAVLGRKLDITQPWESLVKSADLLRVVLLRAARKLRFLKLHLPDDRNAPVEVGSTTQWRIGYPRFVPAETEIILREAEFWLETCFAAIDYTTEAQVRIAP